MPATIIDEALGKDSFGSRLVEERSLYRRNPSALENPIASIPKEYARSSISFESVSWLMVE